MTTTAAVFWLSGSVSSTVTNEPLTAVTGPVAAPKEPLPNRRAPGGRVTLGADPPGGVVPGRLENGGRPAEQLPEVGSDTETEVAMIGSPKFDVVDDPDTGRPNAETHDPTTTADEVVGTVWRNVVLDV